MKKVVAEDSRLELDGEVVRRDGIFAFEGKNISDTETV
jgi:hypothetical protein